MIPLVFGGFCEASEEVHNLIDVLASHRLTKEGLSKGKQGSKMRLGQITGQICRRLSQATVKANTDCLFSRLSLVGDGAMAAGKRRSWQRREEYLMKREQESVWRCMVSGRSRSVVRKGRFWLD